MPLTQTQIDQAFIAMGLAPPSSALLASLEGIDDFITAINTIIQLPQVQSSVVPIVAMFDLALGHDPTSATLSSMVESNLSQSQLATDFVSSRAFANVYNGGILLNPDTIITSANDSIITALFVNGLGHPPTQDTLSGFHGLTLAPAFLEFTQSQAVAASATVDSSLFQILELVTGVPTGPDLPPPPQEFMLTTSQDSVISGQNTVNTTTPGVAVESTGDVIVNAPLSGAGNLPTLSPGDDINLVGTFDDALNATFDGSSVVNGVTILGVQTWNITQLGGNGSTVTIEGAAGALDGVTELNYTANGINSSTLQVGLPGHGIDATALVNGFFNLSANNIGFDSNLTVYLNAASFSGNDTIYVEANQVGNTTGGTSTGIITSTFIEAGSGGSAGFATWNVSSTGAAALNNVGLGALGSKAAKRLDVSDDGSATIIYNAGDPGDWANLQVINASGTTGALTITGGEFGGFGLLSEDTTALKEVLGGSGADSFDLSAYAGTLAEDEALQINGGGNLGTVVELSSAMINQISGAGSTGFTMWSGVPNLLWVGIDAISDVSGAMNWAVFAGTTTVTLADNGSGIHPNQSGNIIVTKAPDGGTFNFQDANQNNHNFSITGADTAGAAGNVINVDYSNLLNSGGTFASASFDKVDVNLAGAASSGAETFYFGGLTAVTNTDASETFTLTAGLTHSGGESIAVGNISSQMLGGNDITLLGGAIIVNPPTAQFSLTGTLDIAGTDNVTIGITNASAIHSTTTGVFDMTSPDDVDNPGAVWVAQNGGIQVSATSAFSTLQGTLGWNGTGHFALPASNDVLTDLAGHSNFYGDGGADVVNIGGGSNTVNFGGYLLNDHAVTQTVDSGASNNVASLGFWGASSQGEAISGASSIFGSSNWGGTSADMTTINGFTIGSGGDNLNFQVAAFGSGLVDPATMGPISPVPINAGGDAFAVGFTGEHIPVAGQLVRIVLDEISDFQNAAGLAHSLVTSTVGNIVLDAGVAAHNAVDFLVAYEVAGNTAINIAEVQVVNTSGSTQTDTANMHVYAQDLVQLANVNFGLTALGINASEIHFS